MDIRIRNATTNDYESVIKIISQVQDMHRAAYEMYKKYGFTEKSINMELLAR